MLISNLIVIYRLEWPVRTLGFSHDSQLIASASEDHFIDIGCVENGKLITSILVVDWWKRMCPPLNIDSFLFQGNKSID